MSIGAPKKKQMVVVHDAIRAMGNKIINLVLDELDKDESKKRLSEALVGPIIRSMSERLTPYALLLIGLIVAILLMTMMTCTLSAMFYFRR